MNRAEKSRPGHESKAAVNLDSTSVSNSADIYPDHRALIDHVHVVVVQIRGTDAAPRYRRRVLFNLPAAQKAVDRAHMAGLDASVILCQLIPAGGDA